MDVQEFSSEFDILYNNITSNQAPALDAYEKSVFLTMAQEDIVRSFYNGSLLGEGFEQTEELRRSLSALVMTVNMTKGSNNSTILANVSTTYTLPDDTMFIVYEQALLSNNNKALVAPTKLDELYKILDNPFRCPNDYRVLRLDISDNRVELLSNIEIKEYIVRLVKRPSPIILEDLIDASINEETLTRGCLLDPSIHRTILSRAVAIAKETWASASK